MMLKEYIETYVVLTHLFLLGYHLHTAACIGSMMFVAPRHQDNWIGILDAL